MAAVADWLTADRAAVRLEAHDVRASPAQAQVPARENLEKHGKDYSLPLPFKVTALRAIMIHANDWFDEWQQACWRTPDALNIDPFQKLYAKREDWARKKRLDSDTKNKDAMDIGNIYEMSQRCENVWDQTGWVDEYGN